MLVFHPQKELSMKSWPTVVRGLGILAFLCMWTAGQDLPPQRGVVLDLCRTWETAGGPAGQLVASQAYSVSIQRPVAKFMIPEPEARFNWRC